MLLFHSAFCVKPWFMTVAMGWWGLLLPKDIISDIVNMVM
jgi:hypothetical protein